MDCNVVGADVCVCVCVWYTCTSILLNLHLICCSICATGIEASTVAKAAAYLVYLCTLFIQFISARLQALKAWLKAKEESARGAIVLHREREEKQFHMKMA